MTFLIAISQTAYFLMIPIFHECFVSRNERESNLCCRGSVPGNFALVRKFVSLYNEGHYHPVENRAYVVEHQQVGNAWTRSDHSTS